jgi:hypothetical protein
MSSSSVQSTALSMVATVLLIGCQCTQDLQTCQEKLAQCQPEAAFTLEIQNDSFATFQPFNNQIRNAQSKTPHRDGFLLQVGDFAGAQHTYTMFELQFASGAASKQYLRGNGPPPWIDILCGDTSPDPIAMAEAKLLVPDENDNTTWKYRLHVDLNPQSPLTAVTLWAPQDGLRAWTESFSSANVAADETQGMHGHTKYFFSSARPCEVRVWLRELIAGTPPTLGAWRASPDVYKSDPATRVSRIVVPGTNPPTHGGPHQPPWNE